MSESSSEIALKWRASWDKNIHHRKWLLDAYFRYVDNLVRRGFPPIFEMKHFAALVGLEESTIAWMLSKNASFYRTLQIPKRLGGFRDISAPSPTLLHVQRWILRNILDKVKTHDCCYGYIPKRSAIENAKQHLGSKTVLKMDLANFFPSIELRRGIAIFREIGYTGRVSYCLALLCFKDGKLPQGGAASPSISNIVGKRLDLRLSTLASRSKLQYTRYADDMTFSGNAISWNFVSAVDRIASDEGFSVNRKKTRLIQADRAKIITGVSISSGEARLPRRAVRDIKNEAYNILRNGLDQHAERTSNFDPIAIERLLGRINFWLQVEPTNQTALSYRFRLLEYQKFLDAHGLGLPEDRSDRSLILGGPS
jgi:RNA-directed DNA polymerase